MKMYNVGIEGMKESDKIGGYYKTSDIEFIKKVDKWNNIRWRMRRL